MIARDLTRGTTIALRVEVADGLWAKFMGLMGRASLPPGDALWLPDSNGIHMMFMRFPIDVVFVGAVERGAGPSSNDDAAASAPRGEVRTVLAIHRALPAWRGLVPLVRGAKGVLELPVGAIDAAGVQVGDLIELATDGSAGDQVPSGG